MIFWVSNRRCNVVFSVIIGFATFQLCCSDMFTAMSDVEELLKAEALLITNLDQYTDILEQKLTYLKRRIDEYQKEHKKATDDVDDYFTSPINAFLLTKRLTSDWKIIEREVLRDIDKEFLQNITNHRNSIKFPSDEDLNGAAVALTRLQDTYKLDTASIARGELNGVQYSSEMTAHDCFEMGVQSYMNKDYYHTSLWMDQAMQRCNISETTAVLRADILDYLMFSLYKQGNLEDALEITYKLLKMQPDHERANFNKAYFRNQLIKEGLAKTEENLQEGDVSSTNTANESSLTNHQLYEALCRNEIQQHPSVVAKLRCRYLMNKPFLKLAPLKFEEANLQPYIVLFHDVIYDSEIKLIKEMAKPKFKRAGVDAKKKEGNVVNYRICKTAWLDDDDHEVVRSVSRRVEDMTGLSVSTAEELQVANYGIGGHYEPHYDFLRTQDQYTIGDRIATVLFYMSDVAQGGATVFPLIRTAVWPKKGAAVFWYNLHASGEGDLLTNHAACPVLAGSKWVSNKWLHERGQEFIRPCEIAPDARHLINY